MSKLISGSDGTFCFVAYVGLYAAVQHSDTLSVLYEPKIPLKLRTREASRSCCDRPNQNRRRNKQNHTEDPFDNAVHRPQGYCLAQHDDFQGVVIIIQNIVLHSDFVPWIGIVANTPPLRLVISKGRIIASRYVPQLE